MQELVPGGRMFWVSPRHTYACHVVGVLSFFGPPHGRRDGGRKGWMKGRMAQGKRLDCALTYPWCRAAPARPGTDSPTPLLHLTAHARVITTSWVERRRPQEVT